MTKNLLWKYFSISVHLLYLLSEEKCIRIYIIQIVCHELTMYFYWSIIKWVLYSYLCVIGLIYLSRHPVRFVPIFHFNLKLLLFSWFFPVDLEKSNFLNSYHQNLPLGHVRLRKKIVTNRFSRFEVYRLQTNRQAKFVYRCIQSNS